MLTLEVAHVIVAIVVVVVLIAAAALISWKSAINYHIKVGEAKVGSAEEKDSRDEETRGSFGSKRGKSESKK